jgi:hypothetical protein
VGSFRVASMSFLSQPGRRRKRLLVALVLTATAIAFAGCKSTALMAPSGDVIYYVAGATPSFPPGQPTLHKVSASTLEETASLTLSVGSGDGAGLLSPDGSLGYIIYEQLLGPIMISKVATANLQQLDQATLNVPTVNTASISPDGAFAYLGSDAGKITEVRLSDLVVTRQLETGSYALLIHTATMAPDGAYAYFGTEDFAVIKVRLADFTVAGRATLQTAPSSAVISADGQYGYYTQPNRIAKVRLADMTVVGDEPLSFGVTVAAYTVISPDGQYAYVMSNANPAVLLTVRLADLKEVHSETVAIDGNAGWSVMAPSGQFAYLGSGDGVYNVKQMRLASPYGLTVAKAGSGSGTVSSTTPGIDCGATCTRSYLDYQSVTLTATPTSSSTFAGWTGACSGTGTCTLAMSEARAVTATFSRPSNVFTAKASTFSTTNSTITISTTFTIPGEGRLKQSVSGVARKKATLCSTTKAAKRAGTYTLTCLLGAKSRTALSAGALRLTVATTFAPTGGTARSTSRTVVVPRTPLKKMKPAPPVTG